MLIEHSYDVLIAKEGSLIKSKLVKDVAFSDIVKGKSHIRTNENCLYIGYWPLGGRVTKSKRVSHNQLLLDYVSDNVDTSISNSESISELDSIVQKEIIDFREVWTSGHDSILPLTIEMANYRYKSDWKQILKVLKLLKPEWMRLPTIELPSKHHLNITINKDSSSGPLTKRIVGNTREESCYLTAIIAEILLRTMKYGQVCNTTAWDLLGREKDIKVSKLRTGELAKTRQVLNPDEPFMFIGQHILQPMTNAIIIDSKSRISIGKELQGTYGDYIYSKYGEYDYIVELDWPTFDIYVDRIELMCACTTIMSNYITKTDEDVKLVERYTRFLNHFSINKTVIFPDKFLYTIRNGLPSGFPGTSLFGSVVNLIRLAMIGYYLYGESFQENMEVFVQGDDALIFLRNIKDPGYKIKQICKYNIHKSLDDIVVFNTSNMHSNKDIPTYLKRQIIDRGIVGWNVGKTLRKILYPKRVRNIFIEHLSLIYNYRITAMGNSELNTYLDKYLNYIANKIDNPFNTTDLSLIYTNMLSDMRFKNVILSHNAVNKKSLHEVIKSNVKRKYIFKDRGEVLHLIRVLLRIYCNDNLFSLVIELDSVIKSVVDKYYKLFQAALTS